MTSQFPTRPAQLQGGPAALGLRGMEREILEGVLTPEEFSVLPCTGPDSPTVFLFVLKPRTGHSGSKKVRVCDGGDAPVAPPPRLSSPPFPFLLRSQQVRAKAELRVTMGPSYPEEAPVVTLAACRGLAEADAEKVCVAHTPVADCMCMLQRCWFCLEALRRQETVRRSPGLVLPSSLRLGLPLLPPPLRPLLPFRGPFEL